MVERESPSLAVRVLGPFEVLRDEVAVDLGGPRQRAVLAHLALARGRVVPVDRLIDRLWGDDAPASATGTLQSYVSRLRAALEPGRRGAAATVLVSEAAGYALRLAPGAIDLERFEALATSGRAAMHRNDHAAALADFDAALALWRGRPLSGVGGDESLDATVTRLDEERDAIVEDRFEVLLRLGRHAPAVGGLQEAVDERPLRERRWGQLALALYRSHRQADALRAIASAREILAEELGLVPGPELQALETQILAHAPELIAGAPSSAPAPVPAAAAAAAPAARPPAPSHPWTAVRLVGRDREWHLLERALDQRIGVVTIEGEAGIGKTAMLAALADEAERRGWNVLWGRCMEPGLAPPLWPWIEVLRALVAAPAGGVPIAPALTELATPSGNAEAANLVQVADQLAAELIAGPQPRLIVLDDLHWADAPTLDLLSLLIQHLGAAPVVLAIGHRPADLSTTPLLAASLAGVTRARAVTRVTIGGLDPDGVAELLGDVAGRPPGDDVVAAVHRRSGGNPLFVTELARLNEVTDLSTEEIPTAVRDIVRGRLAPLPTPTVDILRLAAMLGPAVDLRVLVNAANLDAESCLDALEPAVATRLLAPGEDGRFHFGHDLVRDVLVAELSPLQAARLHLRAASATEELFGADRDHAELIAGHRWAARSIDDPLRVADAQLRAADSARLHTAHARADELIDRALTVIQTAPAGAPRLNREIVAVETMLRVETARSFMVDSLDRIADRIGEVGRRSDSDAARILGLFTRWAKINTEPLSTVAGDAHDALTLAERSTSPYVFVLGTHMAASQHWYEGRIAEAAALYDRCIEAAATALHDEEQRLPPGMPGGFGALALQAAGLDERANQALDVFGRMLRDRLDDQYVRVDAVYFPAFVAALRGDADAVERMTRRIVDGTITVEQPHFSPACRLLYGWAVAVLSGDPTGAELAREAMAEIDAGPARIGSPMFRTYLGEALLRAGDADAALAALRHAEDVDAGTGERWFLAETWRLRALAMRATGSPSEDVVDLLRRAVALADEQGATVFAARARAAVDG